MEGSHSPFGVIWQIATETGWNKDYIMWKINYQTLMMMMADAVRYVKDDKKGNKGRGGKGSALGYFQSRLKK